MRLSDPSVRLLALRPISPDRYFVLCVFMFVCFLSFYFVDMFKAGLVSFSFIWQYGIFISRKSVVFHLMSSFIILIFVFLGFVLF